MSVCLEQNTFKDNLKNSFNSNVNQITQNFCLKEQNITFPNAQTHKQSLVKRVRFLIAKARQRKALANLDDRMLADIGYTAEQAREESRKQFWK